MIVNDSFQSFTFLFSFPPVEVKLEMPWASPIPLHTPMQRKGVREVGGPLRRCSPFPSPSPFLPLSLCGPNLEAHSETRVLCAPRLESAFCGMTTLPTLFPPIESGCWGGGFVTQWLQVGK